MHILITNDDGIDAPGIAALIGAMDGLGELSVVAPLRNHSGASSSLTLTADIGVCRRDNGFFAVSGTPTDCVHLALSADFLPRKPDLIVSGINDGANMGDDTIYSGTVAAAIEGHLFHVPAFAFSMAAKPARHFATGAAAARQLVQRFCRAAPKTRAGAPLLNVNIPDVPPGQTQGMAHTRLGRRHIAEPAILQKKDGAQWIYRIGEAGEAMDDAPGTDFFAARHNQISVTPLTTDLTAAADALDDVATWLAN